MPRRTQLTSLTAGLGCALLCGGCCTDYQTVFDALLRCGDLNASVTADRSSAKTGEKVTLTGTTSHRDGAPYGDVDMIAWDFDGNGVGDYTVPTDTPNGGRSTMQPIYYQPGIVMPAMAVEADGAVANARTQVTVTGDPLTPPPPAPPPPTGPANTAPGAFFNAPEATGVEQATSLDARASVDPDGSITAYRWDFGAPASVEQDGTATPTVRWHQPGSPIVRLTVTDNDGAASTTSRTVRVFEGSRPTGPSAARTTAAQPFTATLSGRQQGRAPRLRRSGQAVALRGIRVRGALRARVGGRRGTRTRSLVARLLRGSWLTRVDATTDLRTLTTRFDALAAVRPAHGRDRGCARFGLTLPAFGKPSGSMRLLGGTGRYSRIRASANFRAVIAGGHNVRLAGTVKARNGAGRRLPRGCRGLLRSIDRR
jgi:hypothetical protein